MMPFHERFKHCIDMTNGTAIINEYIHKKIQQDALEYALKIVTNDGEYGLTTKDIVLALEDEIEKL